MLCVKCKKNMAVVFITKMEQDGKQVNEGYCLSCAKEMNIGPINNMLQNLGITPEEFDSMNSEALQMMQCGENGEFDPEQMIGRAFQRGK